MLKKGDWVRVTDPVAKQHLIQEIPSIQKGEDGDLVGRVWMVASDPREAVQLFVEFENDRIQALVGLPDVRWVEPCPPPAPEQRQAPVSEHPSEPIVTMIRRVLEGELKGANSASAFPDVPPQPEYPMVAVSGPGMVGGSPAGDPLRLQLSRWIISTFAGSARAYASSQAAQSALTAQSAAMQAMIQSEEAGEGPGYAVVKDPGFVSPPVEAGKLEDAFLPMEMLVYNSALRYIKEVIDGRPMVSHPELAEEEGEQADAEDADPS